MDFFGGGNEGRGAVSENDEDITPPLAVIDNDNWSTRSSVSKSGMELPSRNVQNMELLEFVTQWHGVPAKASGVPLASD